MRTVANDGKLYEQCQIVHNTPDTQHPTYIRLTTNNHTSKVETSPYSVRYYSQTPPTRPQNPTTILTWMQIDGGANRSLTNNKQLLSRFKTTTSYNIHGINKDDIALQCTDKGYLHWTSNNGDILYIPCYYSPEASETIMSPTDVLLSHKHLYTGWAQFAHIQTERGHITFYRIEGIHYTTYKLRMVNALWYHKTHQTTTHTPIVTAPQNPTPTEHAVVHRLSNQARFELYHPRCCHAGKRKMKILHKHIQGEETRSTSVNHASMAKSSRDPSGRHTNE
jgi:hypothetical protein